MMLKHLQSLSWLLMVNLKSHKELKKNSILYFFTENINLIFKMICFINGSDYTLKSVDFMRAFPKKDFTFL